MPIVEINTQGSVTFIKVQEIKGVIGVCVICSDYRLFVVLFLTICVGAQMCCELNTVSIKVENNEPLKSLLETTVGF